jgi:hypothetical protein
LTLRVVPTLAPVEFPATELGAVDGLPSFLRMLRPLVLPVRAVPEDFSPLVGLLTLWGLVAVPLVVPCVFAGAFGPRIARGF